jgi:hypothetical protein
MRDTFLARYGHQDIHRLRGIEELTEKDKRIFAFCLTVHIEHEVRPLTDPFTPPRPEE